MKNFHFIPIINIGKGTGKRNYWFKCSKSVRNAGLKGFSKLYNSIYPVKINPYVPPKSQNQVGTASDERSKGAQMQEESRALNNSDNRKNDSKNGSRAEYPDGSKSQIDYSKCKVNISQIITDFKNTALAIGTPEYIVEEVDQYLALAETQSLKDNPNKKLIQTNLKNASTILDDFISKTLNKKSKVVENWVEALFLQQVNYKADPNTINPDFLVKLPDKDNNKVPVTPQRTAPAPAKETQAAQTTTEAEKADTQPAKESKVYIPSDPELKRLFVEGKKYISQDDLDNALSVFGSALNQAQLVGDRQAESMVCFEIGQIFDKQDDVEEALKYYNQTLTNTADNNLKAKASYSMAQIYDDFVYFEPAVNHYYAAITYAGEAENPGAQTKALGDIAEMFAERYDKNQTVVYLSVAKTIALETKQDKVIGAVYSRSGDTYKFIDENAAALGDYKESAKYYNRAQSPIKTAKNYEKASEVMLKLGNTSKAQSLLQKAYNLAVNAGDTDYALTVAQKMSV